MSIYHEVSTLSGLDVQARLAMSRWQDLAVKSHNLRSDPELGSCQPESDHPDRVGLDELTDELSPEELVAVVEQFDRPALMFDPDEDYEV